MAVGNTSVACPHMLPASPTGLAPRVRRREAGSADTIGGLIKHALRLVILRGGLSRNNDGVGAAIRIEPCLISAWTLAEPLV